MYAARIARVKPFVRYRDEVPRREYQDEFPKREKGFSAFSLRFHIHTNIIIGGIKGKIKGKIKNLALLPLPDFKECGVLEGFKGFLLFFLFFPLPLFLRLPYFFEIFFLILTGFFIKL
ncbi:hypothetical protein ES708_15224 [subsurface metagenome]